MNEFIRYKGKNDLELVFSPLPDIIDFHVHIGLTASFPFLKCNINDENAGEAIFLGTGSKKTLDLNQFYHNNFPSLFSPGFIPYSISYLHRMHKFFPTCTIPNLQKYMKEYNIQKSVIQIIDSPKHDQCGDIIKSASMHDNLITFCYVDPGCPDMEEKLKRYKEMGASGLKFHPIVSGFNASHENSMRLFDSCDKLGLPVLAHSGQGVVKKSFGRDPSCMEYFELVFSTFPNLKFVLAHIGSTEYKTAIKFAEKYDNVYLETSEAPAFAIKEAAERLSGEKIFFGTDYSFNHPAVPLSILLDATKDNESFREKILFENANKFFMS